MSEHVLEDVRKRCDEIEMFPEPSSVFATQVEKHAEYLLPLATIDLSLIRNDLQGHIHFVVPSEPEDGLLGEETEEYHNYYVGTNTIAFHVDESSKYSFMSDFKFFEYEKWKQEDPEDEAGFIEEYQEFYESDRESYDSSKDYFKAHGALENDGQMFRHLGGQGWYAMSNSWNFNNISTERIDGVNSNGDSVHENIPLSENGNKFINIGCLSAYYYTNLPADVILFYEPIDRIALISFIWT